MKPQNSKREFETLLMQQELSLTALTVDLACKSMLDFYRSHRAEGCDVSADGDMLLYQWDVVNLEGLGPCLEWNLTRQFMLAETSDEEGKDADDEEIDAGLEHLAALKSLRVLNVDKSAVTPSGLNKLARQLGCKVFSAVLK